MPTKPLTHVQRLVQRKRAKQQGPDHRPSSARRGYGWTWQKAARMQLAREPLCEICKAQGLTVAAKVVDHVKPVSQGGTNEPKNLQSLCKACHNRKTAHDQREGKVS